jgi:hypothetical protein
MVSHPKAGLFVFLGLLWILASCTPNSPDHGELFQTVLQLPKGGAFRGVSLGMPLDSVRKMELPLVPVHDDEFGLAYELAIGDGREMNLEYLTRTPERPVVASIVCNLWLRDMAETSGLYGELENHWGSRYGVADGPVGKVTWKDATEDIWLSLSILEDKKSISFNFVPLGGF